MKQIQAKQIQAEQIQAKQIQAERFFLFPNPRFSNSGCQELADKLSSDVGPFAFDDKF